MIVYTVTNLEHSSIFSTQYLFIVPQPSTVCMIPNLIEDQKDLEDHSILSLQIHLFVQLEQGVLLIFLQCNKSPIASYRPHL